MVFGHNLFDGMSPEQWGEFSWLWRFLHHASYEQVFPNLGLIFGYPVIPWIGVMALGYLFGAILQKPPTDRDRLCVRIGVSAVLMFLVLRGINIYGDSKEMIAKLIALETSLEIERARVRDSHKVQSIWR